MKKIFTKRNLKIFKKIGKLKIKNHKLKKKSKKKISKKLEKKIKNETKKIKDKNQKKIIVKHKEFFFKIQTLMIFQFI